LRLKHKQTQKVKIILDGISKDFLHNNLGNLSGKLQNYKIENLAETLSIVFEREADDDLLGKTVSYLTGNGAKILDIETEKPTLLDVLESYE